MISVSQEVVDLINADSRTFRAKFKHGDSVYDKIMSLKWNVCLPSSSFSVGNALSIGIQCTAFDVPVSIKGEELELVITIEGSADEISIGSFTAEKPTIQNGIVSFNAYDDMSKAGNIPYNSTLGEGKHTVNQYVADVAEILGIGYISLGSEGEVTVENDYLSGNSCRNALAYLAGYLGRNCVIKNKKISMKKFTLVHYTMNADRIEEPELEDIDSEIDFIIAQISSNNTIMNGNGATGTELVCPIMTESQLSNVANMLFGDASLVRTYRSGKVKLLLGDPRLELCDVIKLDYKDTEYIIPITSISFEYDGGLMTDIEAYALKEPTLLTPSQRLDFAVQEEVKKVLEQLKNIDGTYFYIRYSPNADGSNMTEEPDDKTEYIGVCSTNQSPAPGEASDYTWSKFKGKDGSSNFFHVKYSNDGGKTFTGTDGETAGEYIGILVDSNEDDSTNPSDYTWSKIVGKDGGTLQVKYKNSATAPAVTNNDVSGWSDEVPAPEKGKRTYMVQKLSNETNWSTPIQISAEDGTTPTVSINQDGYWVINGEATTVKAQGTNGKTPNITVGDNGNWFVDGVDTNTKAQGAQGKDGADIEYVYYRSSSSQTPSNPSYNGTTLSDGWTASPQGITETYKYEYVSVRTKPAGSTSWGAFSTPVIWSKWGEKGTDGDGVEYKYYLKNNATKPTYSASDANWTDEPTGVSASNMYEYVVQITHHGDGNTTPSQVALWSKWGETGDEGRGVSKVVTEYYLSTSETTQTGGSWSEDAPEWVDGRYLWTRLATTYTDGKTEHSDPVVDASWKKTSVVDAASKELNETLANALGLHVTEHTVGSSKIRYYHSNPSLTSSKSGDTILVFNAKGFGVCTTGWNGGNPVFQNGAEFEKGKAVWNILVANKISADLIETGSIKSLPSAKVQTTINLDDGTYTSTSGNTKVTIQGGEVDEESGAETTPAGILLDNLSDGSTIQFSVYGMAFLSSEYQKALSAYAVALVLDIALGTNNAPALKPADPYFSSIAEKDIKTTNIHCKNIYIAGTDGNEYNLLDELTLMAEETNSLRESLSALQEKYTELLESIGQTCDHSSTTTKKENVVSPTCTEPGSYDNVVYCATCGEEITDSRETITTDALGHNYTSVVTSPTETTQGYTTHTCSRCGHSYVDSYTQPTGCQHEYSVTVVEPTCTEQGYTLHTCLLCGATYKDSYTEATGHKSNPLYFTQEDVVEPTCTEPGSFTKVSLCTKCNAVLSRSTVTVEATGHTDENGDGYCDTCSAEIGIEEQTLANNATTTITIPLSSIGSDKSDSIALTEFAVAKFVPPSDGTYTFESVSAVLTEGTQTADPWARLYNSDKSEILVVDDDTAGARMFKIEKELEGGETYYLAVKFYYANCAGTVDVKVTKQEATTPTYAEDTIVDGTLYIGLETTDINNTSAYANRTDIVSVVIPDGITSIGHLVFSDCTNLKTITIPASVISIGSAICQRCTALTDVYYKGTETQWNTISIGANNTNLTNATIHYNS